MTVPLRLHITTLALSIFLLTAFNSKGGYVYAQSTDVTCHPNFDWTTNNLNQNACLIAAFLLSACSSSDDTVPSLAPDGIYTPSSNPTPCECSTITYALLSTCALCQGGQLISWTTYSQTCDSIFPMSFPVSIPPGTQIPPWAYQNITDSQSSTFDVDHAQASYATEGVSVALGIASAGTLISVVSGFVTYSAIRRWEKKNGRGIYEPVGIPLNPLLDRRKTLLA